MKDAGVKPDHTTYDIMMRHAGAMNLSVEAWAIVEDMIAMGVRPTASTFGYLLSVSGIISCVRFVSHNSA